MTEGGGEATTFQEFAVKARREVAEIERQERARLANAGVDAEEIEARMDCLRLGLGAMVEGKRVDPLTVRMFYREDAQVREPRVPRSAEVIYRMASAEDGSVTVWLDA